MATDTVVAEGAHPRHPRLPEAGVVFKDITPLLADGDAFRVHDRRHRRAFAAAGGRQGGRASRRAGFILAAPVAYRLGAGFVPVRKPGKLPWEIVRPSSTSSSTAPTARGPPRRGRAGRAGPGGRRRAGHRRHRPAACAPGRAARRRGGRLRRSSSSWASCGGRARLEGTTCGRCSSRRTRERAMPSTVDRVLPWRRTEPPPADEVAPLLAAFRARHPKAPTAADHAGLPASRPRPTEGSTAVRRALHPAPAGGGADRRRPRSR